MAGRFQFIETPVAAPGCCKCCGSATKKFYIDTGTQEEFYGAVYYCCECIGEMANLAGFVSPIANFETLELLEGLYNERQAYQAVVKDFIDVARRNLDLSLIINTPDDSILESINSLKQKLSVGKSELGEGERTSTESSNDEGMDELRSVEPSFQLTFPTRSGI